MTALYIDADACPVRDEALRVAARHKIEVFVVSNGGIRPSPDPLVRLIVVGQGPDVADDWIAERAGPGDVVVTNDVPLAARCLAGGARAIRPKGLPFTPDSIGMDLATRDLMTDLRAAGTNTRGPAPFAPTDRSRFLDALEVMIQTALRG